MTGVSGGTLIVYVVGHVSPHVSPGVGSTPTVVRSARRPDFLTVTVALSESARDAVAVDAVQVAVLLVVW
jgi:hypothetical protein